MGLNTKQQLVMDKLVDGRNIYIGGSGGVGKSYLVRHIMSIYRDIAILAAPTGIAALNIGGSTINSLFKLPLHVLTSDDFNVKKKVADLFGPASPVRMLIIDEISMVRLDKLHAIDQILRKVRGNNLPFGGLQVIVVGDFFQLAPVVGNQDKVYHTYYPSSFAFGDHLWTVACFEFVELDQVVRQTDEEFIYHLQNIRKKTADFKKSVDFFNKQSSLNFSKVMDLGPLMLCTTNAKADTYNGTNYAMITGKERRYTGQLVGQFDPKDCASPIELDIKVNTKVIITANGPQYKNGQTGYVLAMKDDCVEILLEDTEEVISVNPNKWVLYDYIAFGGKITPVEIGSYTQLPLRQGWAVTIHRTQGMTLSNGLIDFGYGCFASGQAYVALSRIKGVDSFALASTMMYSDVIVSEEVKTFYEAYA